MTKQTRLKITKLIRAYDQALKIVAEAHSKADDIREEIMDQTNMKEFAQFLGVTVNLKSNGKDAIAGKNRNRIDGGAEDVLYELIARDA